MRIVRIENAGRALTGILDDGEIRVVDGLPTVGDEPRWTGERVPLEGSRLLAPVVPSKVIGVGRNYVDHIVEMGYDMPVRPSLFMKPPTALLDPGGTVVLPPTDVSDEVEHEAELAIIVGRTARWVREEDALEVILGYTCANDVSARDLQRSDDSVIRGKGYDTFCPLGPWIETDVDLSAGLSVRCTVNDELRQDGSTSSLLFGVPTLISYLSSFMTLLPGDVILTGSPGGSGRLRAGDRVRIEIGGIGELQHDVA
jgi:2-keto-4-pentenoate hydratase/2-oxohepta-3-ene-1,7-dioic acid hydratase in catechol pathway